MTISPKTFAYGTLEADTDSWLLAAEHVMALDVDLLDSFDGSLEHKTVSVVSTMSIPRTAPGITKFIVKSSQATTRSKGEPTKSTSPVSVDPRPIMGCAPNASS